MGKILANSYKICPQGFPHQGEIYKVYFSKKGKEIGKIRPALVISNNAQNEFDDQIIVVPLTSEPEEVEKERPFTVLIKVNKENGLEKISKILLNRVQTIDIEKRLRDYIGRTSPEIIKQAQEALKVVLSITFFKKNFLLQNLCQQKVNPKKLVKLKILTHHL